MRSSIITGLLTACLIIYACKTKTKTQPVTIKHCTCDTTSAWLAINNQAPNRVDIYDSSAFTENKFYELDSAENRLLWYRDIESWKATKFTSLWNSYYPANYYASQSEFIYNYCGRNDIELAFQFGPNHDLWAYHIFVIKKAACCYLITRSYYRHARFTYKAYSVMTDLQADSLYTILDKTRKKTIDSLKYFTYSGVFADNRNRTKYYLDFQSYFELKRINEDSAKKINPGIEQLFDFVDKGINWKVSYDPF